MKKNILILLLLLPSSFIVKGQLNLSNSNPNTTVSSPYGVFDFNRALAPGDPTDGVKLYNSSKTTQLMTLIGQKLTSTSVEIRNLDPKQLQPYTSYKIVFPAGAIEADDFSTWPASEYVYSFTTGADNIKPDADLEIPGMTGNQIGQEYAGPFKLIFDEVVTATSGLIRFRNINNPSRTITVPANSANVVLSTASAPIPYTIATVDLDHYLLSDGTGGNDEYDITILPGAFVDGSGNSNNSITYPSFTVDNNIPNILNTTPGFIAEENAIGAEVGTFNYVFDSYALVNTATYPDNSNFFISGNKLYANTVFDYETKTVHTLGIEGRFNNGQKQFYELGIVIADVVDNAQPTHINLAPASISENNAISAVIGTLSASDANGSDTHTFSIVAGSGGVDNSSFSITGNSLHASASFNYEEKSSYSVRVGADDGKPNGIFEKVLTVSVSNQNENPTDLYLSKDFIEEGNAINQLIGYLSPEDEDAFGSYSYSLVSGAGSTDNSSFNINGNALRASETFDYGIKSTYSIRIRVSNTGAGSYDKIFTINILEAEALPELIGFSPENGDQQVQFGLNEVILQFDKPVFQGTASGVLTFYLVNWGANAFSLDYDAPEVTGWGTDQLTIDVSGDLTKGNTYDIRTNGTFLESSLGTNFGIDPGTYSFKIDNIGPVVTTTIPTTGTSDVPISSNLVLVFDDEVVPNSNPAFRQISLRYNGSEYLNVNPDFSEVTIDGNTVTINFVSDLLPNTTYDLGVSIGAFTDASENPSSRIAFGTIVFTTESLPNNEPSNITLSDSDIDENDPVGTQVGTFITSDADGIQDSHTYTLVPGVGDDDNGNFAIDDDQLTGAISFNYENKNAYSVRVRTTDSEGAYFEKVFSLSINNVNEYPSDIILSSIEITEGNSINDVIGTLLVTDPDENDTHTFSLNPSFDHASFVIEDNLLKANEVFDFENDNAYKVSINVVDAAGFPRNETFDIAIVDAIEDETPTNISLSQTSIDEKNVYAAIVGTFTTEDANVEDTHTYTLVSGTGSADNDQFHITANTLYAYTSFNYEAKSSYSIRVRSSDLTGFYFEKQFTITINDVNEITNFSISNVNFAENNDIGDVVGTLTTQDPEVGDTHTYDLVSGSGDVDNALFSISGDQLIAETSFNYEEDNTRNIRVRTTDNNGLSFTRELQIYIIDELDGPAITGLSPSNGASGVAVGTNITITYNDNVEEGPYPNISVYDISTGDGVFEVEDTFGPEVVISGNTVTIDLPADLEHETEYGVSVGGPTFINFTGDYAEEADWTFTTGPANSIPTDIVLSNSTIEENNTIGAIVGSFSTTDPDGGDSHSYSLVAGTGDTDNASFSIDGANLQANAVFDFETKSSYSILVQANDGNGGIYSEAFTITVIDLVEDVTSPSIVSVTPANGSVVSKDVGDIIIEFDEDISSSNTDNKISLRDYETDDIIYDLGDPSRVTISGNTITTSSPVSFMQGKKYYIIIDANAVKDASDNYFDGLSSKDDWTFTINSYPSAIHLSTTSIQENNSIGDLVATLTATDADAGDTHTFSLVAGTGDNDNSSFTIDGDQLIANVVFDFETEGGYSIRLRAEDDKGGFNEFTFNLIVTDIDESSPNLAPTNISLSEASIDENNLAGAVIGTFSTTDQDVSDTHTYTLVSGTGDSDNGSFMVDGADLQANAVFDFEAKSSYSIRVRTDDGGGGIFTKTFTITVDDVNENPTDIQLSSLSIDENNAVGAVIGTLSSTDADESDTHTYALVAGSGDTDNESFTINGADLQANTEFDFESKSSYSIRVQTNDGSGGTYEDTFTITINDVDESSNTAPTAITLSTSTIDENNTVGAVIGTLSSTDADESDTHTYALVEGTGDTDNGSFTINGADLQANAIFDFESKLSYSIRVQTNDGNGGTYEDTFTITINDVDESSNTAPTAITLSTSTIDENNTLGAVIGTLGSTDADESDTHTYTLVAGTGDTDNGSFTINGADLQANEVFDFESKSSYSIRVQTNDGNGGTFEETFTITINDVDENSNTAPTAITLSASSINENNAVGAVIGTLGSIDADESDTHTYTLVAGTGDTDNGSFTINGADLQANAIFDFESKLSYSIRVQTNDGNGGTYEDTFTITINDVDESSNTAPTAIALSTSTIDENNTVGAVIGTLSSTDADESDTHTYTLVAGTGDTDNGSFTINGADLQVNAIFDFETKSSYSIRVQTNDGSGGTFEETFTVTINDVDESSNTAPTAIALSASSIDENNTLGAVIGTLSSTDADESDTHTYTLVAGTGDTDNGSFTINNADLQANAIFDFETKSSYSIRVQTNDGNGGTYEGIFTVVVTNLNEAPTAINIANTTIAENLDPGTTIGEFSTQDPDDHDTFIYSFANGTGDMDNGNFTIENNVLKSTMMFDYETKASFSIRIRSTDLEGLFIEKEIAIDVSNITSINLPEVFDIQVYPNPASSKIYFSTSEFKEAYLIDSKGNIIISKSLLQHVDNHEINISELRSGIYYLKLKADENVVIKRIMIK